MMMWVLAAMAAATKLVWEGGKWIVRSIFPSMAPPPGADVEDALERVAAAPESSGKEALPDLDIDAGKIAFDHALSTLSGGRHPAPDMTRLPEDIVKWVARLSAEDLQRLTQHGAKRVGEHVLGERPIADLPLCREARLGRGFARVGDRIVLVGRCAAEAPAAPSPEDARAQALEILQDLIEDQPEPVGLAA
ncbi:hypothetical protein ASF58_11015 [Methylobacterium sp. Leaf125]|nr:hypothetical protein ASF58_11015 [Methylobacterium sp. Leaf125]